MPFVNFYHDQQQNNTTDYVGILQCGVNLFYASVLFESPFLTGLDIQLKEAQMQF
jgi:hypothetical protein